MRFGSLNLHFVVKELYSWKHNIIKCLIPKIIPLTSVHNMHSNKKFFMKF